MTLSLACPTRCDLALMCLTLASLVAIGGCATHTGRLANPRAAFYSNDLPTAHQQLQKLNAKPKNDHSVVELDLAMVELLNGDAASAESRLRAVRDNWDELERKSVVDAAASLVTDDQRRAYAGEDYEKLVVRVMLTLTSLMQDGVDAESYSLQTLAKQADLLEHAKSQWNEELPDSYCVPAIAPYLRGVLREATFNNYDDAARSYAQALELMPDSALIPPDLARVQHGVHSPPGHGIVYVIAMVGRGPYKRETSARATSDALLVADRILSAVGEYSVPPTLAPVKIPEIVSPPLPFDLVGIEVNGLPTTTTLPITDFHQLAADSYSAKLPQTIARAVARRVIKKGAVYAAKDHLEASSDLASLAMDAAGVLWEASESADTRCWGLLPREVQIVRLELPSGTHELGLEPITAGVPVAASTPCQVNIVDGQNTYVLAYFPDFQPIGKILVSR